MGAHDFVDPFWLACLNHFDCTRLDIILHDVAWDDSQTHIALHSIDNSMDTLDAESNF